MSNKPVPQRGLGTVLRSFFDHVTSHDEEGVHAALCMVANVDLEDSTSAFISSFSACYLVVLV